MNPFLLGAALVLLAGTARAQPVSENVVVVTIDGLRFQEMFGGADEAYFKRDAKGIVDPVSKKYAGATPEIRRATLMPFMWNVIANQGQVFGDPARGSRSHLTNGLWFSYPGYNELLSGAPDSRVDSKGRSPIRTSPCSSG